MWAWPNLEAEERGDDVESWRKLVNCYRVRKKPTAKAIAATLCIIVSSFPPSHGMLQRTQ
jgi:hypothetical protein